MDLCSNLLIEDTTGAVRIAHLSVRNCLEGRKPSDFVPEVTHHQGGDHLLVLPDVVIPRRAREKHRGDF